MTNEEKFKTAEERIVGWGEYCKKYYSLDKRCSECPLWKLGECRFHWLDLEYEAPPREMEDIIRELRELSSTDPMPGALAVGDCISTIYGKPIRWYLGDIANEIEAAWEREAKAIATENAVLPAVCITKPVGNAAEMREALEFAVKQLINAIEDDSLGGNILYLAGCMRVVANKCKDALSAPLRNCDIRKKHLNC